MPPEPRTAGRWTLVALILASGLVFLDSSVVNVALPAIQASFDTGLAGLQWVVDGYILSLSALLITGGSLGDLYGKRRLMLIGIAGFALTSLVCGLALSVGMLVVGRLLQGVAGALMVPGSLAIINSIYSDQEARGRAIGTWAGWSGITTVFGPFVGGWLVDVLSWNWVFFINLPLAAITIWLMLHSVPETPTEPGQRLDPAGVGLTVVGLSGLTFGLIEGPNFGWDSTLILGALAVGLAALIAFPFVESRQRQPMVPLEIFRFGNFSAANLATLCVYAALAGTSFFNGLYVQNVMGYSATAAGAAFVPISVLLLVLSPPAGQLAGRLGPRWPMAAGPLISAGGALLLLRLRPDSSYWLDLLPAVVVMGIGLGVTVAPLTTAVMGSVPAEHSGIASAVNNVAARIAGLLAVAGLGVVSSIAFAGALANTAPSLEAGPAAERFAEVSQTPTGVRDLSGLPQPAVDALTMAYTDAYRQVVLANVVLLAAGGIISAVFIRNPPRKDTVPGGGGSARQDEAAAA